MSEHNKEIVRKVNDAFSKGNLEIVSEYTCENIMWNIVGMPLISGRKNFLETMKMIKKEYCSCISIKNIIAEGDYVVVESSGSSDKINNASYCSVYLIKDSKIFKLTTYIVDTALHNDL